VSDPPDDDPPDDDPADDDPGRSLDDEEELHGPDPGGNR
jgi:hypothetical protein